MRRHLPRTVKVVAFAVVEALQKADPVRLLPPRGPAPVGSIGLVCIYRRANARWVIDLCEQLPASATVRLWSLDEVDEQLRHLTVGSGPGGRLDLLNRLIATMEPSSRETLVVADDDIAFFVGDLPRLLHVGRWLGLDLFQPAHSRRSGHSFQFTRKRWLLVGRRTTFVEQGPLVVLSARAQRMILPFPADFGMGWGVEVAWSQLASTLRLGIVDAVAVRHRRRSATYDRGPERQRLQAELAKVGATRAQQIQQDLCRHSLLTALRQRGAPVVHTSIEGT